METVNGGKDNKWARNLKADYVHSAKQKLTGTREEKSGKRKHITLKSIWLLNTILTGSSPTSHYSCFFYEQAY